MGFWSAAWPVLEALLKPKAAEPDATTVTTIGSTPITAGMVRTGLAQAESVIHAAQAAWAAKFANADDDFVLAEDVTSLLAAYPPIAIEAQEATLGLQVAQWLVDHSQPADAQTSATMRNAAGPENPSLGG